MTASTLLPLVSIEHHNIALLFANYLSTLNVDAKVLEENNAFVIYCQASQIDIAKEEFELFIKAPFSPKYQQAAWQHGEVSEVSEQHPDLLATFKTRFLAHAGFITLTIFILCWAVFIASLLGFSSSVFYGLRFFPELSLAAFLAEPYRIIGPALFHFSWLHIVFNTMWWWQLGGDIERVMGKGTLLNVFFVSAIASNLAQYLVTGPNFGGLSGVVYALIGYVWWMGWLAPEKGLTVSKPIVGILLVWMLLGFAELLPVNMANMAHLVGLVSGCLLAVIKVGIFNKKAD